MTAIRQYLGEPVAAYVPDQDVPVIEFFDEPSVLACAVYTAFYRHYPIKLNPNVIWLTILQGLVTYVERNAEVLRDIFVSDEGRQVIAINRPDFVYRRPSNDWPSVFCQFSDGINARTKPGVCEMLECDFSNTTATDRACAHITLMNVCEKYFEYVCFCGCGIPRVDLLGTVEDWHLLWAKTEALKKFERPANPDSPDLEHFSDWVTTLLAALDQFVAAAEGRPDLAFWGSACNTFGDSGGVGGVVTGWVSVFFPFQKMNENLVPNWAINTWRECFKLAKTVGVEEALREALRRYDGSTDEEYEDYEQSRIFGIRLDDFPSGLASAPVRFCWGNGKEQKLLFYGGLFAMHQHPDGALEPRTGWAVVDAKKSVRREQPKKTVKKRRSSGQQKTVLGGVLGQITRDLPGRKRGGRRRT
jgi:hypothetical protein